MAATFPKGFRMIAAIVLAIISLQATPVRAVPVVVEHGSAFSASTSETAVLIRGDQEGETRALGKFPPSRPQPPKLQLSMVEPVSHPWPDNRQTGPPGALRPPENPASPRYPPVVS